MEEVVQHNIKIIFNDTKTVSLLVKGDKID